MLISATFLMPLILIKEYVIQLALIPSVLAVMNTSVLVSDK
jgi:hypothetical protein